MTIALARIATEAKRRTGTLDLSDLALEALPEALFDLQHLSTLAVGIYEPRKGLGPCNQIDAQRERFGFLLSLKRLSVAGTDLTSLDFVQRLPELQDLDCSHTEVADLAPLAGLAALRRLDCSATEVADLAPLAGLNALQDLDCSHIEVTDLAPLSGLNTLQRFKCFNTKVADLSPLFGLNTLQHLDCTHTKVVDLAPLSGLAALQRLDCSLALVADLMPLSGLAALRRLDCFHTEVADLAPLAELAALQQLHCSATKVADLSPLAGLNTLQALDCSYTEVADLSPLSGLAALRGLDCSHTEVADLAPLSGLTALQRLDCSTTGVADLAPLSGLAALRRLDCSATGVADLAPLSGLATLQSLNCSWTPVADLSPLFGLNALQHLDCSGCRLRCLPPSIFNKPSLRALALYESHVPGMPPAGVLSQDFQRNCLDAVRAHFADLADGSADVMDIKLLLLGNGGAGKTQIGRRLAGKPFESEWNSTHGIEIDMAFLPGAPPIRLHIWDFGGQDIYHGTHTLFLRSPAVMIPVWAEDTERSEAHEHSGLIFRNYPLDYWIDVARYQGHPSNPVLIVQSKCDRPEQEILPFPIRDEALKALPYRKQWHISVKENRGWEPFMAVLREAVTWLRNPEKAEMTRIGAGRLRVQRRLEALRDADRVRPRDNRLHRLLEREEFEKICAEEGGVTSPAHLLAYLDANGTVFHRPGLFGDRLVLDQSWALEAIYAVFDRAGPLKEIRRSGGRFTRLQLERSVWRDYSEAEQKLFISMMRSCGICFLHRCFNDSDDQDGEYIAPDLLPQQEAVAAWLPGRWDPDAPGGTAVFRYALLHGGLIRAVMSEIGEAAGPDALYWQGGVCGFEAKTGSRLLIEQEMTGPWQGEIRVQTQRG